MNLVKELASQVVACAQSTWQKQSIRAVKKEQGQLLLKHIALLCALGQLK